MRLHRLTLLATALGLVLILSACQTTRATRSVEESGFLGDYSQLRKGEGNEAQLVYIDRTVSFAKYDSVIIDSVSFWHSGDTKVSEKDQQMLTDALYLSLDTKLKEHGFATVKRHGPNVLRLRAAITQAKGAKTAANAITSVIPQTRLLATLGGLATDTALLVGEASIEVDIRDSQTDRRVAAGVDQRAGTKAIRAAFSEWKHVTEAFDYWGERIAKRLQELKAAG